MLRQAHAVTGDYSIRVPVDLGRRRNCFPRQSVTGLDVAPLEQVQAKLVLTCRTRRISDRAASTGFRFRRRHRPMRPGHSCRWPHPIASGGSVALPLPEHSPTRPLIQKRCAEQRNPACNACRLFPRSWPWHRSRKIRMVLDVPGLRTSNWRRRIRRAYSAEKHGRSLERDAFAEQNFCHASPNRRRARRMVRFQRHADRHAARRYWPWRSSRSPCRVHVGTI
jgi:hypothetical protein